MKVGQMINLPRLAHYFPTGLGGYQALREEEADQGDVEAGQRHATPASQVSLTSKAKWAPICSLSTLYTVSFLCNALLVLLGYAGWEISSDRDSNQSTKNTSRFISATAYSIPALIASGLLLFSLHRRKTSTRLLDSLTHVKLFFFIAASNALASVFMVIFATIFDDPETRFGTGDDCRNALVPMIIIFHIISLTSALGAIFLLLRELKTIPSSSEQLGANRHPRSLPRGLRSPLKVAIPFVDLAHSSASNSKAQP